MKKMWFYITIVSLFLIAVALFVIYGIWGNELSSEMTQVEFITGLMPFSVMVIFSVGYWLVSLITHKLIKPNKKKNSSVR